MQNLSKIILRDGADFGFVVKQKSSEGGVLSMKKLYIVAAGAITALGHDALHTVASLRSGLDRFKEIPFLGESGDNLQVARVEGYAEALGGIHRYVALALKALRSCLAGLSPRDREDCVSRLAPCSHQVPLDVLHTAE